MMSAVRLTVFAVCIWIILSSLVDQSAGESETTVQTEQQTEATKPDYNSSIATNHRLLISLSLVPQQTEARKPG